MKAEDLTADHLGETITLGTPEGIVTGLLCGVRHEADLVEDRRIFDEIGTYCLSRQRTYLTLAGWGERQIKRDAEITIGRTP